MEYFVGIDLHKFFFVYHAEDNLGNEFVKGRLETSLESIDELINLFPNPPKVVVEAGANWMWFTRSLEQKGCKVTLAHPLKVKAIASARIKTDKIDAKILCHLLRGGLIPQSHMVDEDTQDNRELSRARISLVHDQTMLKNRIYAILTKENLKFTDKTDTFGVTGKKWLNDKLNEVSESKRQMIRLYLKRLDELKVDLECLDALIKQKSSGDPKVKLLSTIPGIGPTTAFLLSSEIGDVSRFQSSKAFTSYFGLVPRLHQSGTVSYYGRITKLGNPYVRWSLGQAAHRLYRMDVNYRKWVDHLSYRVGKKKAIVALSRKIATFAYAILKSNHPYLSNYTASLKVNPDIVPGK